MKHRFLDNYKPSIEYALSYSFIIVTLRNILTNIITTYKFKITLTFEFGTRSHNNFYIQFYFYLFLLSFNVHYSLSISDISFINWTIITRFQWDYCLYDRIRGERLSVRRDANNLKSGGIAEIEGEAFRWP